MRRLAFILGLALAGAPAAARAADWSMEPSGSRLEFTASFEKNAAPGVFNDFDVRMQFDPDKPAGGRLDVAIRTASADMSSADINKAIRGPEWFDAARFPQAEFHATQIARTAANRFLARGVLSLRGAQQPVEVPFTWTGTGDAATLNGEISADRRAFGIGTGEWAATNVVGAEVKVRFSVRLRRVR
jgi:polyisoprenoid-binding protein YceI